ncbi:MAG: hypothetical protein KKF93_06435 [Candidatus Omnitrophica bacterium]|nr:hypothetical protein [Candidatus Omnitrophota bacterium]
MSEAGVIYKGDIGGVYKKKYWTPDGREIMAVPSIRTYRVKDNGNTTEGIRDTNYDKGWLDRPPENPKLRCISCDKWHDTQIEVDKCLTNKKKNEDKWMKKAKKEVNKEDLEPIFTFALGENVEGILGRVYDAVVSGLRLSPASGAMTTNDAEKVIRAVEKEVKKLKLGVDAERIASEIPLYILDFSQQRKLRDKDAFLQAVEAGTKKEINFAVQALRHKAAMAIRRLTEIEYHGSQRLITIIEKHLKDRNAAVREDIGAALRNLGVNVPLPIQMMKKPQAETKVQVVKREPESPQIPSSESSNGQITGPQESIKAMLETRTVRHKVDSDDLLIEKKEVSLPGQVVMCETSI